MFKHALLILSLIIFLGTKYVLSWSFNPICLVTECCNDDYLPGDIKKLDNLLQQRVYGQHLVKEVVHAIAAHWNPHYKPRKALTLSFHGWPGGGKNYVSSFISESLYKLGSQSKYVHHFIGRIDFPLQGDTQKYKNNLYEWLKGNISSCPRQLFIFDEVDKMPSGVLNAIKPVIDYRDVVDGKDYTKAIFIFLSNTGAGLINQHYEKLWNEGKQRESLTLKDFEKLIAQGSFNEEGGFHRSDTIKSNLIDHYVPFLPMQEQHVTECIKDQFRERFVKNPEQKHIQEVMDFIEWGPDSSKLFSKTGCKRISSKVALLVNKHYTTAGRQEL